MKHLESKARGTRKTDNFYELQLAEYQVRVTGVIATALKYVIKPFVEFTAIREMYMQHFLSFALYAKYKTLLNPFMTLHAANPSYGRTLVVKYDIKVIPSLLQRTYFTNDPTVSELQRKEPTTSQDALNQTESRNRTTNQAEVDEIDNQGLQCFIIENVET